MHVMVNCRRLFGLLSDPPGIPNIYKLLRAPGSDLLGLASLFHRNFYMQPPAFILIIHSSQGDLIINMGIDRRPCFIPIILHIYVRIDELLRMQTQFTRP